MKTEIKVRPHNILPDQSVIELWYDGEFIGTVTGADGPGVRVLSKYPKEPHPVDPMVLEIRLALTPPVSWHGKP